MLTVSILDQPLLIGFDYVCTYLFAEFCVSLVLSQDQRRTPARQAHHAAEPAWKQDCRALRIKGCLGDEKPWSDRQDVRFKGLGASPRVSNMADCVWGVAAKRRCLARAVSAEHLSPGLFMDASQNLNRGAFGGAESISLLQNSQIYSFEGDCILDIHILAKSLSYPLHLLSFEGMTRGEALSCIGEAISLPCLASILHPLLFVCCPHIWSNHKDWK